MTHLKKRIVLICGICLVVLTGYMLALRSLDAPAPEAPPHALHHYKQVASAEVNGRQGVAVEGDFYWVSGSASLAKYDKSWNLIASNETPFATGYTQTVNHIGDIDVYQNEIYCGVELFLDGVATNIQIAVYDGDTLQLKRSFPFHPESGQQECSGIAVNPDDKTVWMSVWADGESGKQLYRYDLETGAYLGRVYIKNAPPFIQGVAYYHGNYYFSADDGNADLQEPDHIYRVNIPDSAQEVEAVLEYTVDDVILQGEIEGLSFDRNAKQLLLLYNRGAKIVNGMPTGFYDGYDHEIHEVFTYEIHEQNASSEQHRRAVSPSPAPARSNAGSRSRCSIRPKNSSYGSTPSPAGQPRSSSTSLTTARELSFKTNHFALLIFRVPTFLSRICATDMV